MWHESERDYRKELFVTVEDIGNIMKISKSFAYEYVQSEECPFYRQRFGKRIIIPTKTFFEWYDSLSN